jgi:hypothetical protein
MRAIATFLHPYLSRKPFETSMGWMDVNCCESMAAAFEALLIENVFQSFGGIKARAFASEF